MLEAPPPPPALITYDSGAAIRVMDAGGGRDRVLVPDAFGAAFSPDGTRVAFSRSRDDGGYAIHVARADGTGARVVARPGRDTQLYWPRWSPDGTRLAFSVASDSAPAGLDVVGADGSGRRRLVTRNGLLEFTSPTAWSPDGGAVLYDTQKGVRRVDVATGADSLFLARASGAVFSPDGTRIAFTDERGAGRGFLGRGDLAIADADGSNRRVVVRTRGIEESPAWSPDGTRIAFASDRNLPRTLYPSAEIYTVAVDGSCLTWLTNGNRGSYNPAWVPGPGTAAPERCGDISQPPRLRRVGLSLRNALWLGLRFGRALVTRIDRGRTYGAVDYYDCSAFLPSDCPDGFMLERRDACEPRAHVRLGRPALRVGKVVVAGRYLLAHGSTVEARGVDPRRAARALRPAEGGPLGAPRANQAIRRQLPERLRRLVRPC